MVVFCLCTKIHFEISKSIAVLRFALVQKPHSEVDCKECLSSCQVKEVMMIGKDLGS